MYIGLMSFRSSICCCGFTFYITYSFCVVFLMQFFYLPIEISCLKGSLSLATIRMISRHTGVSIIPPKLKRIVLLNKMTRWEILSKEAEGNHKILSYMETQFPGMVETHRIHSAAVEHIVNELRHVHKVDVEVIKAQSSCCVRTSGLDAIISAGGDGTFLEAASLVKFTPLPCFASDQSCSFTPCVTSGTNVSHDVKHREDQIKNVKNQLPLSERQIWVFGLNTDPTRSEGQLLMKADPLFHSSLYSVSTDQLHEDASKGAEAHSNYYGRSQGSFRKSLSSPALRLKDIASHYESLSHIVKRLTEGNFTPILRRRLRVSIIDNFANSPECFHEVSLGQKLRWNYLSRSSASITLASDSSEMSISDSQAMGMSKTLSESSEVPDIVESEKQTSAGLNRFFDVLTLNELHESKSHEHPIRHKLRLLDYRAVNDVFLANFQSNLTLYVEVCVDDEPPFRSKNSGVLICTGSGSTAWAFNISKITEENVKIVTNTLLKAIPPSVLRTLELPSVQCLTSEANANVLFGPEEPLLRYVIREPVDNRVFRNPCSSAFCKRIKLTPLTVDSCLYLDGLSVVPISYGQTVCIEIGHEEDCLLTAV